MKKRFFLLITIILFISFLSYSQHPIDLDMLFHPKKSKFLINGLGGADFKEKSMKQLNSSAKFDFVYNLDLGTNDEKRRNNLLNFSLKFNPAMWNTYETSDVFNLKDLYFTTNKSAFFFGINRYSTKKIGEEGFEFGDVAENYTFRSLFTNFSFTQYLLNSNIPENKGFSSFKFQLGGQYGLLLDTDYANLMFNFSFFATYFHILDNSKNDRTFEELLNSNETLASDFTGVGAKILFQINNYSIHFETRYYQTIGSDFEPPDFVPLTFSMGATITGSILKIKEKRKNN